MAIRMDDGKVQLSFTLPVEWSEAADEAARQLAAKMGFDDVQVVDGRQDRIRLLVFRALCAARAEHRRRERSHGSRRRRTRCRWKRSTRSSPSASVARFGSPGACIGTDAHTVGIDAILNMKGYKGDYGLERYHTFETFNLGSQVAVEELVAFHARERASMRCLPRRSLLRKEATSRTSPR